MRECLTDPQLSALLDGDASDPRWRHVESCPECGARMALLRAFVSDLDSNATDIPPETRAELRSFIARETRVPEFPIETRTPARGGRTTDPEEAAERERQARRRAVRTQGANTTARDSFRGPQRGWLLAAAATIVVAAGVTALLSRPPRERASLRGSATEWRPMIAPADSSALSWPRVPGAEAYRVVVLSPELANLGRFEMGSATRLTLQAANRPATVAPGSEVLVRVVALRGGGEQQRSPLVAARWP